MALPGSGAALLRPSLQLDPLLGNVTVSSTTISPQPVNRYETFLAIARVMSVAPSDRSVDSVKVHRADLG